MPPEMKMSRSGGCDDRPEDKNCARLIIPLTVVAPPVQDAAGAHEIKTGADKFVMSDEKQFWKVCSSCKKPIGFNVKYWICSVSTCNQKRTGWVFCTVECWDAHVPKMNHRESWALEKHSPSRREWEQSREQESIQKQTAEPKAKSEPAVRGVRPPDPTPQKVVVIRRPKQD